MLTVPDFFLSVAAECGFEVCPNFGWLTKKYKNNHAAAFFPKQNFICINPTYFNHVNGNADALRLVFKHELAHYLMHKNGFESAGHNAFFIAAHARICGGWREYQSSGALAMDRRQTAVWHIERAQEVYKKAGGLNVDLETFGENLADEVSIKNHIFDSVFSDSKNGFKRFKILFFISAIILVSLYNFIIKFTDNP